MKEMKMKKKKQKKKERTAYNLVIFNCELCEGLFQDEHDSLFFLAINWRRRLKFSFEKCMQNNFYALKFIAHYNQVRWIEIHLPYSMSVCVYVPKEEYLYFNAGISFFSHLFKKSEIAEPMRPQLNSVWRKRKRKKNENWKKCSVQLIGNDGSNRTTKHKLNIRNINIVQLMSHTRLNGWLEQFDIEFGKQTAKNIHQRNEGMK